MAYRVFIITTICCLQAANAASTKKDYVPIKYPGPIQDVSDRYGTVEEDLPDACKDKGFCTVKPKDYPQERFNAMFKGTAKRYARETKHDDSVIIASGLISERPQECVPEPWPAEVFRNKKLAPQPSLVVETFGDRQGDPDATDNCESFIEYEPLFKVRSTRGQWHTVIQAPEENYVQKVRLETCKEIDSACFQGAALAPSVVTFCKQKYSVWQFLVSDGNNGTETIKAELPVCCSCHYKIDTGK